MRQDSVAMAELLESKLLRVWPSVSTTLHEGWAIRLAHGYSGRSNSASALVPGSRLPPALLDEIEATYRVAGQASQFRLSPLATADAGQILAGRGYRALNEALTMTALLQPPKMQDAIAELVIETTPSPAWLSGVTGLNDDPSKRRPEHLHAIVSRFTIPAAFATISLDQQAAGFGLLAVDDGWAELGSIILAPQARGKGLGRKLVTGLLGWSQSVGARQAFLQVDATNDVAISLYRSLGFSPVYRYQTMRRIE